MIFVIWGVHLKWKKCIQIFKKKTHETISYLIKLPISMKNETDAHDGDKFPSKQNNKCTKQFNEF